MINIGIVGGTGYTGVELLRLLVQHPEVNIKTVTSRGESGRPVADIYPSLRGHTDVCFSEPSFENLSGCDVVFFATPNGTAMQSAPELLKAGVKVIDLSADFRIQDIAVWEKWYGMQHACPELVAKAVYGLPEMTRDALKTASLVACAGCYPTATQLGFLPLLEEGLIDASRLIADTKSGVSGAGRKANVGMLMGETGESFKAYSAAGHRHLPEIIQGLNTASEFSVGLTFVPHLVPMIRGINATLYGTLLKTDVDLQSLFEQRYQNEAFVDVLPAGSHPETRSVRGSNMCQIALHRPQDGDTVVVLSVIDNVVKGAAGQAVQCMNIACGLDEKLGLQAVALSP